MFGRKVTPRLGASRPFPGAGGSLALAPSRSVSRRTVPRHPEQPKGQGDNQPIAWEMCPPTPAHRTLCEGRKAPVPLRGSARARPIPRCAPGATCTVAQLGPTTSGSRVALAGVAMMGRRSLAARRVDGRSQLALMRALVRRADLPDHTRAGKLDKRTVTINLEPCGRVGLAVVHRAVIHDVGATVWAELDVRRAVEPANPIGERPLEGGVLGKSVDLKGERRVRQLVEVAPSGPAPRPRLC